MDDLQKTEVDLIVCKTLKSDLCGSIIEMTDQEVIVKFTPNKQMISDENNIIHSGFIFNAANYAAMCLVNQPNSLTIKADVQFLAPIELEQEMIFIATIKQANNKKYEIFVRGTLLDIKIFQATFYISIFEKELFKLNFQDTF